MILLIAKGNYKLRNNNKEVKMRLLKISQNIVFKEDAFSGVFKKGQEITFSGYLDSYGPEIFTGYMKQEPIDSSSITLCVKGHIERVCGDEGDELVVIQTTEINDNPITMCSYFPCVYDNEATGYLDNTDGIPSKEGKYFFICGDYIAETQIKIEGFEEVSPLDNTLFEKISKKKMRGRFSRLYYSEYTENALHFGFLFDYIQPHWRGALWRLIHIYPNK